MTTLATPRATTTTQAAVAPVLLSIVIPARNGARRIGASIRRVVEYLSGKPYHSELVLVDDASRDETVEACVEAWETMADRASGVEFRVLRSDRRRGKGYSVRQGMLIARGEWILFADADSDLPIDELDRLFTAVCRDGADVAIASRLPDPNEPRTSSLRRRAVRTAVSRIARSMGLPAHAEMRCGLRLYGRSAGRTIASLQRTWRDSFDVEHILLAERLGYQVADVGVDGGNGHDRSAKGLRNPVGAAWDLVRMRWAHRSVRHANRLVDYTERGSTIRLGRLVYETPLHWRPRARG